MHSGANKSSQETPKEGAFDGGGETFREKEEQQQSGAYIFLPDSERGQSLTAGKQTNKN